MNLMGFRVLGLVIGLYDVLGLLELRLRYIRLIVLMRCFCIARRLDWIVERINTQTDTDKWEEIFPRLVQPPVQMKQ